MFCISDNYLYSEAYKNSLQKLAEEKPTTTPDLISAKSQRILQKIQEKQLFQIEGEKTSEFYLSINKAIKKISLVRPGRKLLKRLIAQGKILKIYENHERAGFNFRASECNLGLSPKLHTYHNSGKEVFKHKFKTVLAHELIHALHFFEEGPETVSKRSCCKNGLIDPEFHSQEELLTVCGFLNLADVIVLCENAFLKAWGLNLRTDHNGIESMVSIESLGIDHYFFIKNFHKMQESILNNPTCVNQLYNLDWLTKENKKDLYSKNLFPLSIAAAMGNQKTIEFLLDNGANIAVQDDLKGPIAAACFRQNYQIASYLITKAKEKQLHIDVQALLTDLIEGYKERQHYDDDAFFSTLWELETWHKELSPKELYTPLFHRTCSLFRRSIFSWFFNNKGENAVNGIDIKGNNALLAILEEVEKEKPNWGLKFMPHTKLFFELLNLPCFNLKHQNNAGETISTIAARIGEAWLIQAIEKKLPASGI